MLVRLQGWDDVDVLTLLTLLRKHLLYYIYTSNNKFVEVVHAELPQKPASEIKEMVRSLMLQFALGLSTKNFRTDVIVPNENNVYVYEHIYESISELPENKVGGMWLPDELSRFLQKACQYRNLFLENEEMYFKRIQVWSKSVAETKSKFYACRDIYMREKKRRLCQRKGVEPARLELLKKIYSTVPPTCRTITSAVCSKALKLWSTQDMEALVDFVVRITAQIQRAGSSDLVDHVAEALHRTDGSCVNKLADMKEKFVKKLTTVRAAHLPDIIYDPTSEAHKIFSADWSNHNDPYALGYIALKSRSLKLTAARNRARQVRCARTPRLNLRSSTLAARGTSSTKTDSMGPIAQDAAALDKSRPIVKGQCTVSTSRASKLHNKERAAVPRPLPVEMTAANALPVDDYTVFVHDMAAQCQWTEKVVHNVLQCMQHFFGLYRSNRLVAFFYKVASKTPGILFQDLFPSAQFILVQFERRMLLFGYGSLDGFEKFVTMALDKKLSRTTEHQANDRKDTLDCAVLPAASRQHNMYDCTHESKTHTALTAVCTQNKVAKGKTVRLRCAEEAGSGGGACGLNQSPSTSSFVQQTVQLRNDSAAVEAEERKHVGTSFVVESPSQTPQTGIEDAADEHSPSTVGKQFSPGDNWDEGLDADVELDDDSLDDESSDSSDSAWSGSSDYSDTKISHHNSKDSLSLNSSYSMSRQHASDNSKSLSKRSQDEQYGKSFAKKRRPNESNLAALVDDDHDDEDDDEDENYNEVESDAFKDEDTNGEPLAKFDSLGSDEEQEETPHPLQSMLNNLKTQLIELQEKQRALIERKEESEWRRQRDYACTSTVVDTPSYPFEKIADEKSDK